MNGVQAMLADIQTWHEARGLECDRVVGPFDGSMARFLDRADWLYDHPVWEFRNWRLDAISAESAMFKRPRSLSVPRPGKPKRVAKTPVISEDRQLQIALAAMNNQRETFTKDFIGSTK